MAKGVGPRCLKESHVAARKRGGFLAAACQPAGGAKSGFILLENCRSDIDTCY